MRYKSKGGFDENFLDIPFQIFFFFFLPYFKNTGTLFNVSRFVLSFCIYSFILRRSGSNNTIQGVLLQPLISCMTDKIFIDYRCGKENQKQSFYETGIDTFSMNLQLNDLSLFVVENGKFFLHFVFFLSLRSTSPFFSTFLHKIHSVPFTIFFQI
jgi:hypothetical protein